METQQQNKGQSLVEIVVAVGIITVVLVGVSDLIIRSLGLSSYQAEKNIASNIAQNQLNYYRQIRDERPTDFFDLSVNNQSNEFSTCVGVYDSAKYGCTISYLGDGNGVEMKVVIDWKNGDNEIKTELSQTLAKPIK